MMIDATNASAALPILCRAVLSGDEIGSRAGKVREKLFTHVVLTQPWRREILAPGRKANVVAQIAETLWVLSGRNDVEWLSAYLPRAKDFSDDGKTWRAGYGPRIRNWDINGDGEETLDQLAAVVRKLRANPEDRRAVICLWDPVVDNEDGLDIPCNDLLHFLIRDGALHLHVTTRSNDLMWGWSGINAFEWSVLQELVASMVGVGIGELHFAISSLHLYEPYWPKAERITKGFTDPVQLADSPGATVTDLEDLDRQLGILMAIEADLRADRGADRPFTYSGLTDPMLRNWMQVLAWHWTRSEGWIESLKGTRLYAATREMPKSSPATEFAEWASKLHAEKHAIYGDSWKKRGEKVSIQANIARKVDRLGKAGAGDTELDTTTDLLIYLLKYWLWLQDRDTDGPSHVGDVRHLLVLQAAHPVPHLELEETLTSEFELLLKRPTEWIDSMIEHAFALALQRYTEHKSAPTAMGQTHAERNATRSWNPEAGLCDDCGSPENSRHTDDCPRGAFRSLR